MKTRPALLVSIVIIILAGISAWSVEDGNLPWLEILLMIPSSWRPFSREGSRLGLVSEWSVKKVSISVQAAAGGVNRTFTDDISSVEKLADVVAMAVHSPSSLISFLQDVKKWNYIFQQTARTAYITIGISAIIIVTALMITSTAEKIAHSKTRPVLLPQLICQRHVTVRHGTDDHDDDHDDNDNNHNSLARPLLTEENYNVNHSVDKTDRTRRLRDAFVMMLAIISGLCGIINLLGASVYALTIKSDIQIFLPALIKSVQLLCITHGADACKVITHARYGLYLFLGVNAVLIVLPIMTVFILAE